MSYVRFSESKKKNNLIPSSDNIYSHITDFDKDYYTSIFEYNDEHFEIFKKTRSLSGIKDVVTSKLYFDFDSKEDVALAKSDTIEMVKRLREHGIQEKDILICFSGKKGYHVQVNLKDKITQPEFKQIVFSMAEGLKTFDEKVHDPQRIIRIVGTKHNETGLYKIPLTTEQLKNLSVDEVKNFATNLDNFEDTLLDIGTVDVPKVRVSEKAKKEVKLIEAPTLDLRARPKWMSEIRFALQEGFFPSGEGMRNHVFLVLGATYRKQGFNKQLAYRMLKGVAENQAAYSGDDRYPDDRLWKEIVEVVYHSNWKGGIYKDSEDPILLELAARLGISVKKEDEDQAPAHIHSIHDKFKDYVMNIDKNTIRTGIESLDKAVFISVGANVGIVGAPGSGKSSLALNILNNTSKAGIKTVFASFDMARTRMYEKILYKLTGYGREKLYNIFKNDPKEADKLHDLVKKEFGNVYFYDKSAATVSDIRAYIEKCNEQAATPEDKVKLVMIDYFEMVSTDVGDETAASKKVAQELQGIVNSMDVAQIVLLQPNKMTGDMREPIKSYTSIKGSSFLAQSFRIALGIYREGFDPTTSENDKFLTINVLKNDLGEAASLDFSWDGKRGEITELDSEDETDLHDLRNKIAAKKESDI